MSDLEREEEETCRICRCGSEEGELFHPCLCRGSVKFVHSDCLKEWLNSSRREKKCDICKASYKFKSVIPDDAPNTLNPAIFFKELVVRNVKYYASRYLGLVLLVFLYVILLPMIVMGIVRFYSLLIDDYLPKDTILRSLLAGHLDTVDKSFAFSWHNIWQCFKYSYPTGLKLIIIVVITVLQVFVLNEWVSTDEGLPALLNLEVGDEKMSGHVELFIRAFIKNSFPNGVPNQKMTRKELDQLILLHELSYKAEVRDSLMREFTYEQFEEEYDKIGKLAHTMIKQAIPFVDSLNEVDPDDPEQPIVAEGFDEVEIEEPVNVPIPPVAEVVLNPVDIPDDEDEEVVGGLGLGFAIEVHIDMLAPPKTLVIVIVLLMSAFAISYFIPSVVGIAIFRAMVELIDVSYNRLSKTELFGQLDLPNTWVYPLLTFFKPYYDEFEAVYHQRSPVSMMGRIIPLATDVSLFFFISTMTTYFLGKPYRDRMIPLRGHLRSVYTRLFHIRSILKVFTIFATEIVAFPVFCGYLLDFVSSPVFIPDQNFISKDNLFTSDIFYEFLKGDKFFIFCIYWITGTAYMCFFATYVGMIRRFVLRPGVLFFIRSPDDQNTRLIHDALVRPFGIQISRILLSGSVYTVFILVGFGIITLPVRYFTSMLPMKFNLVSTFTLTVFYVLYCKLYRVFFPVLRKFARIYWFYAIAKAAQLTRMSSFILGVEDVRERGSILYRSTWHRFFSKELPDFENPIDGDDLEEFFAVNPDVNCAFVPDGYWIKAPDNDRVSRLHLRNLFYPVRSDGTDFDNVKPMNFDRKIDNLLGEKDEINDITTDTVVFRPPNFGLRNFVFVTLLWFFAAFLILLLIITSNIIGYPFARILGFGGKFLPDWSLNLVGLGFFSDHVTNAFTQLSFSSIIIGFVGELLILKLINNNGLYNINRIQLLKQGKPLLEKIDTDESLEQNLLQKLFAAHSSVYVDFSKKVAKLMSFIFCAIVWFVSIISIHKYLLVAILSPNGLSQNKLANDVIYLKSLNYDRLKPLLSLIWESVSESVSISPKAHVVVQVGVSLFTIIPFALALKSHDDFLARFKQFMKPQLSSLVYLALYSAFKVGSIVPGLTGNLSSTQWEVSFGFALFYYIYQQVSIFNKEVILKRQEEIRNLYYATGEVLVNYEEQE